ncbi:hypothetical protein [Streptomyces sp. NPDC097619]|uniref:hypothetical protein n=1 Tax=Streptomyces sp. NPDC097619 TaxID=3157228 RepID=UPI003324EB70
MSRRDLPPPPPSAEARAWEDPVGLRAARAAALGDLVRSGLGITRLLLLWLLAVVFALGWSFLGIALMSFEQGDRGEFLVGVVFTGLGSGILVPAGFWAAAAARRDRDVRRLLCAWAEAGRDPEADARLRTPRALLGWLGSSALLAALGLWVTFGVAAAARSGVDTPAEVVYAMGLGLILWITGLLGIGRAAAHHRWVRRALPAPPSVAAVESVPAPEAVPVVEFVPAPVGPEAGISPGVPAQGGRAASKGLRRPW